MVWVPPPYKRNSLTGPLMGIIAQGIMQRIGQGHQAEEAQKGRDWRAEEAKKQRDYQTGVTTSFRTHQGDVAEKSRAWNAFVAATAGMPPAERALALEQWKGYQDPVTRGGPELGYQRLAGMVDPTTRSFRFGGQPGAGQQPMGPPSMDPQAGPPGQMEPPEDIPLVPLIPPEAPSKKPMAMPGFPGQRSKEEGILDFEDEDDFEAMDLSGEPEQGDPELARRLEAAKAARGQEISIPGKMGSFMEGLGGQQQDPQSPGGMFESLYRRGPGAESVARTHALFPQPQQEGKDTRTALQKNLDDPRYLPYKKREFAQKVDLEEKKLISRLGVLGLSAKVQALAMDNFQKMKIAMDPMAQMWGVKHPGGVEERFGTIEGLADEALEKTLSQLRTGGRGGGGPASGGKGGEYPEAANVPAQHRKGYIAAREAGQTHEQAMQLFQKFMSGQAR